MRSHGAGTPALQPFVVLACLLSLALCLCGAPPRAIASMQRGRRRGHRRRESARSSSDLGVKHEVRDARKRQAVCNDGSPAIFYFQPGGGADRHKWIVFFQGGGGCVTDAACTSRWSEKHKLMTSSGAPMRLALRGLLSGDTSENPDFAGFNRVLVHYCSSDAWAGDAERTLGGRKLEFRGHRVVDAVIEDLMDDSVVGSPTLREATDVLVAGSSAGALGVQNNVDRIAARLPWAQVKAVADSGWVPDVEPYGPGTLDVRPDASQGLTYYNAEPDASCVAANPKQPAKCLLESFVYPYLTTPTFVYADQRDRLYLGTFGVTGRPTSDAERAWVRNYGRLVREGLERVPAAFSPSVGGHTALSGERFRGVTIDGHTFAETLASWYFGRPGPVKLIEPAGAGRPGS